MAWLVGVYILSLVLLLVTAFWTTDPFTSRVKPGFTLENFQQIFTVPAFYMTALRTLGIALAVTVISAIFAIPLGVYMAKIARPRAAAMLAVLVTLPLWAGYLVKIVGMRLVWTENGFFNWLLGPLGIQGPGFGVLTVTLTLVYLWFPYMAIPVYTAISQIPANLFDASSDLGARGWRQISTVITPMLMPALIAGSIFTFSLSLGDYIAAMYVGGSTQMIGSIIAQNINLNPPLAAAFSMVPIVIVFIYLAAVRRTGALNNL
jgi:putative spermidine/putrescine transport system permease protein